MKRRIKIALSLRDLHDQAQAKKSVPRGHSIYNLDIAFLNYRFVRIMPGCRVEDSAFSRNE